MLQHMESLVLRYMPLEADIHEKQKKVFTNLLRSLMPKKPYIEAMAPNWLEFILYHDDRAGVYQLFAFKAMEKYYEGPAVDVEITLRLPEPVISVLDVALGKTYLSKPQRTLSTSVSTA